MNEDAGKKKFIKDFLQKIIAGDGFYEDMQIERSIKPPGSDGEGSTARSLSGNIVANITQLLEDDLRHTFDDGFFTFRLVNAQLGSGKTSLLCYLHELAKTKSTYKKLSIVKFFRISDLISIGGEQSLTIKFYSHILGMTFWHLLNSSEILIQNKAKSILNEYLEPSEVVNLIATTNLIPFCSKYRKYFSTSGIIFEKFLFEVITQIIELEPRFTFVYLIDDLDHLKQEHDKFQEIQLLIKALIRTVYQDFGNKTRLMIYIAGTSETVIKFLSDPVLKTLILNREIILHRPYKNEFEIIRNKIDERIRGAFQGYNKFDKAWQEIKNIEINPADHFRDFYKNYVTLLLEIYEKYFKEEPEKVFEGNAKEFQRKS